MRWILRIGYGAILLVVILAAIAIYHGVTVSSRAKKTLQATLLVIDLTKDYATSHDGAWPDSWETLEEVAAPNESTFDWPADSAEVRQRVEVDFDANPHEIAGQTPEEFNAIQPIGPYFPYRDLGSVQALIDAVGEHD